LFLFLEFIVTQDKLKKFHPFQYMPFGGGRRLCIGLLAKAVIQLPTYCGEASRFVGITIDLNAFLVFFSIF